MYITSFKHTYMIIYNKHAIFLLFQRGLQSRESIPRDTSCEGLHICQLPFI